jgi:hypothetical protein
VKFGLVYCGPQHPNIIEDFEQALITTISGGAGREFFFSAITVALSVVLRIQVARVLHGLPGDAIQNLLGGIPGRFQFNKQGPQEGIEKRGANRV